ncbi:glycosyltransferase family 1 protein [Pseudomonas dryadis]|uniref:Glycosyltransferase family 1 protein n=2 Tax=Pseudomonadales TaxID=72274 RepID=A0ABY1ZDN5_9GAMM|nr:glycosyltransferase family 1 protein [Pseudomonas dryadis]TBV19725.1 glycosyltransferase family 1 protein [Pseudomonas sp. FRB 230]
MVVNDPAFFISHRLPVAEAARNEGYTVLIATMDGANVADIRSKGFEHYVLPLSRSGKHLGAELRAVYSILRLLWRVRPTILHLVTIKPVLYGGLAARLAPVGGVVSAVSGLGFVFMSTGRKAALVRKAVSLMYRLAFSKKNLRVIFQNTDDRDVLLRAGVLADSKVRMIRGSGVDLTLYQALPEPEGVPVVCFAARLLRDKGVYEYVEAVRVLQQRGVQAAFRLVGDPDPGNPTSIISEELEQWREEGAVEVLGYRKDIARLFADSHLVVLPSYREGLPKVLVEAAACGRAVVTTDVAGCRDAIEPGESGLLVPVRSVDALADAMQRLIEDAELRQRMGAAGRVLAEREFGIHKIAQQHLGIYGELESNIGK